MSQANFLEKLLHGGVDVKWIPLGDSSYFHIANSSRRPVKAGLRTSGSIPYFGANNIQDYVDGHTHDGEFVLIAEDGSASLENYSIQHVNGKFWANNHVHVLGGLSKVNTRYLFHFLQTFNFMPYLTGGGRAKLTKAKLIDIPIPLPCTEDPERSLEIQKEIVRILDSFTELETDLETELEAELEGRKKQYTYYRDKLLAFEESEVEWRMLSEVAEYSKTRIGYDQLNHKNYVGVDSLLQNRAGKVDSKHVPVSGNHTEYRQGDILIGNIRPYLKKIWHADIAGGTNGDVLVIRVIDEAVDSRFLYQMLADYKFFEYNMQHAKGAKMPRGDKAMIMNYSVPVPKDEAVQQRIISILDKFDTLTNSISEGIPEEIDLRRKQYEYYRNLLFKFPMTEKANA